MVFQDGGGGVPQVLGREGAGQRLPAGAAVPGEEVGDLAEIPPRPPEQVLPAGEGLAGIVLLCQPLLPKGGALGELLCPPPLLA